MIGAKSLFGTVKLEPEIAVSCRRISCTSRTKICVKMAGFLGGSIPDAQKPSALSGGGGRNMNSCWKSFDCFRDPSRKGQKVEVESVHGGVDVWDSGSAEVKFPEHLVIMVNGIIGSADDWRYAADQFVKKHPDKVIVHRSECNTSRLTFDGVDLMGERLAEEVMLVVKRRPGVQRISFVAHSLGGLVARYAIGRLFVPLEDVNISAVSSGCLGEESLSYSTQYPKKYQEGKIAGLEPMNFITFATPHLGSRGHKQLPFLCGLPFLERRASQTAHWIVGQTGKHLFLTDNADERPPLLLRMVDDCDDLKFMSALCSFKRRVAYANANFDRYFLNPRFHYQEGFEFSDNIRSGVTKVIERLGPNVTFAIEATREIAQFRGKIGRFGDLTAQTAVGIMNPDIVGWRTSSIRRPHELPKKYLHKDEKYPHIVYIETEKMESVHQGASLPLRGKAMELEEEMIRGLNQVTWERVDVSFHRSKQRYIAHNTIQVKSYWMNSDGADVVFHMIDNFLF